jgi:Zn-dependent peptidase ImmA (M78 family)
MANSTNTVAKGNAFEDVVYTHINQLLDADNFIVPGKLSKIHRKKGYYSESRKGNIIVDISIETILPGANTYSILTIIECKDYESKVSIDNLEEFVSKIDQIAGKNTKGIFFTTSGFSETCINYAKAKGLWLIVYNDDEFSNLTYRKAANENSIFNSSTNVSTNSFYATNGNEEVFKMPDLLMRFGIIDTCTIKTIHVPFVSDNELSKIATICRTRLQEKPFSPITFDDLQVCVMREFDLTVESMDFSSDESGLSILGAIDVVNNKIYFSNSITDAHRRLFTVAHELGHWILHRNHLLDGILRDEVLEEGGASRIEIQANKFASFLLVPESTLRVLTRMAFDKYDNPRKDRLWWDLQPCNMELAHDILGFLSEWFNVSKEMLILRMENNKTLERHFDQGGQPRERKPPYNS